MLQELFKNRTEPLLSIYFTAGFPQIASLPDILVGLEQEGVDMVEIGMPYSDPLSDGPTIQNSGSVALKNGMTTDLIFEQLASSKTSIPKIMMGYFNAVFLYGVERFCKQCHANGVSGVILPDLPIDIYQEKYKAIFERYEISFIHLITPQTSEERIRYIDGHSNSFIYAVSSASTTGRGKSIRDAAPYLSRLKAMGLKNPLMVGFNISTKEDFDFITPYAAGGIIGSAFIKKIAASEDPKQDSRIFVQSIRKDR